MTSGSPVLVRSNTYRWYAIAIWVLLAALVLAALRSGDQTVTAVPVFGYVAALTWAGMWRPKLIVDDDGATVVNPLTTVRVPFDVLIEVSTKWALTLVTPGRRVAVFCAPQPGRMVSWQVQRRIRREGTPQERRAFDQGVHVGALPGTESGDAAGLVKDRWQAALAQNRVRVGEADVTPVPVYLNVPIVILVVAGAAAAVGGAWAIAN